MLGPVFWLELLRAARRGQHHRLRQWLALALFSAMFLFVVLVTSKKTPVYGPPPTQAEIGLLLQSGLVCLVLGQLLVILLVAPAFAAGSITDEKTTGTLQHLLSTPLESRDIIVGKWLAQMVQSAALVLPATPLIVLVSGLIGLSLADLTALVLLPFLPLPALVASALLASVWTRRTTSAIAWVFVVLMLAALLAWWLGGLFLLGPADVLTACFAADGSAWNSFSWLALAWLSPAAPCLGIACWRLRPAYRSHLVSQSRSAKRVADHDKPPVGNQPLRWAEKYLGQSDTLPVFGTIPPIAADILVVVVTGVAYGGLAFLSWNDPANQTYYANIVASLGLSVLGTAGLMIAVRCAGSISAERERQTWDMLLLTPLEPRHLLRGKLWGNLDVAGRYLLIYLAIAFVPAVVIGLRAVFWLVLTWLSTWIVMYFTGATGLNCSVRSGSSWRALLRALLVSCWEAGQRFVLFGVFSGFLVAVIATSLPFAPATTSWLAINGFMVSSLIATVIFLLDQAERNLELAERHIAREDRIPQGADRFLLPEPPSTYEKLKRRVWS